MRRRVVPIRSVWWALMRLAEGGRNRSLLGKGSGGRKGRKENGGKENSRLSVVGSEAMEGQAGRGSLGEQRRQAPPRFKNVRRHGRRPGLLRQP